jgi:hypothetical protein
VMGPSRRIRTRARIGFDRCSEIDVPRAPDPVQAGLTRRENFRCRAYSAPSGGLKPPTGYKTEPVGRSNRRQIGIARRGLSVIFWVDTPPAESDRT